MTLVGFMDPPVGEGGKILLHGGWSESRSPLVLQASGAAGVP